MSERTLLDSGSPITQSIDAVKSLLAYVGRTSDPLPTSFEMPGERCVLVLSNKKDVYYTVTLKACSCPSATYWPGQPCKHQRKYFPAPRKDLEDLEAESDVMLATMKGPKKLVQPPVDSIRPECKWPGGFNGPVDLDTIKAESLKSSILTEMLIDCGHDTTLKDIEYWQRKQGQEA
jgi:hypothetical protein